MDKGEEHVALEISDDLGVFLPIFEGVVIRSIK